jgi:hypothetical protein
MTPVCAVAPLQRWGCVCAVALASMVLGARPLPAQREAPAVAVQRGWRVNADAAVRVYLPAGRLTVSAWDRDSVHLAGTLGANAALFGGGAAPHVKVGVEARSRTDATLPSAQLVVHVPRRARLWIKMIDGDLEVSGTRVEVEAYTVRGHVSVRDVEGSTTVESIDAPVTLTGASGDIRIRGSRAQVALARVTAIATISTVSGTVTLQASPIEGRIETVGGAITVDAVRAGGSLTLQTHAGDIVLSLPASARPRLALWSRGGAVRDAGPPGNARHGSIEARSFKGNVTVRARP